MTEINEELLNIAIKMAQDLQDYADEAERAGAEAQVTKELLDEWEEAYQRLSTPWQEVLANDS